MKLLQTLIIENCFSVYLIIDLVQCNRQLKRLKIKRKTFQQPMMLSDTLYLEELDVKLCPEVAFVQHLGATKRHAASLVLGENLSLSTIRTNCQVEFNSRLPRLETLIYTSGYQPKR